MNEEIGEQKRNELYGKFIEEHSDWVRSWAMKNIPEGSALEGVSVLTAGLGCSVGIFVDEVSKSMNVSSKALIEALEEKLHKEIK